MSKSLVNKATSDDPNPPPGPVLHDLAKRSKASSTHNSEIRSHLLKRLQKKSPDIKYKVLTCIRYLSQHGRDAFRLELQRDNEAIRACTHFKGPLDPLRGDAPYQRVRDAAKEAMLAIFDNSGNSSAQAAPSSRIQGFGSSGSNDSPVRPPRETPGGYAGTYGGGARSRVERTNSDGERVDADGNVLKLESGAYSSGRMQGFGNPAFESKKSKPGLLDRIAAKVTSSSSSSSPARRSARPPSGQPRQQFRRYEGSPGYNSQAAKQLSGGNDPPPVSANTSGRRKKGRPGGSWGAPQQAGAQPAVNASPARAGSRPRVQVRPAVFGETSRRSERTTASSSGEYEGRLVDQITTPSGVRMAPKRAELSDFARKAQSLDHVMLCELLMAKFESEEVATVVKSLYVVQYLLKGDAGASRRTSGGASTQVAAEMAETFAQLLTEQEELLMVLADEDENKQIRDRAQQILIKLGLRDAPRNEAKTPARALPRRRQPAQRSAPQQQQQQQQQQHEPQPEAVTQDQDDMWGFMEDDGNNGNAEPEPVAEAGGFDFIGGDDAGDAGASDMFANLNVKSPEQNAQPSDAAAAAIDPLDALLGGGPIEVTTHKPHDPIDALISGGTVPQQQPQQPQQPQHPHAHAHPHQHQHPGAYGHPYAQAHPQHPYAQHQPYGYGYGYGQPHPQAHPHAHAHAHAHPQSPYTGAMGSPASNGNDVLPASLDVAVRAQRSSSGAGSASRSGAGSSTAAGSSGGGFGFIDEEAGAFDFVKDELKI